MKRRSRWLALVALVAAVGCKGYEKGGSTTKTSSGSGAATGTTTGSTAGGTSATGASQAPTAAAQEVTMPSGLKYRDLVVGTGAEATAGKNITVHYTGWLTDGTQFDSSLDSGRPYPFTLGTGAVIRGWDEGLAGMKVGGKRKLTIPPSLAHGPEGRPPVIPPGATLVFDVELIGVN